MTHTTSIEVSGVLIVLLTPGPEESVVNWLPSWQGATCCEHNTTLEWSETASESMLSIHQHSLISGQLRLTVVSSGWVQRVSDQQKESTAHSSAILKRKPRNGQGQALCLLRIKSGMIVIFYTPLKGAVMELAVNVNCKSYNEASAFFAVHNMPTGTLCCLFTGS